MLQTPTANFDTGCLLQAEGILVWIENVHTAEAVDFGRLHLDVWAHAAVDFLP